MLIGDGEVYEREESGDSAGTGLGATETARGNGTVSSFSNKHCSRFSIELCCLLVDFFPVMISSMNVFVLLEERQIAEESLEIETRNLTDKLLQLSGQLESSVAEKDSLLLENQKLCSESQTLRRDFDALVAEKALLGTYFSEGRFD